MHGTSILTERWQEISANLTYKITFQYTNMVHYYNRRGRSLSLMRVLQIKAIFLRKYTVQLYNSNDRSHELCKVVLIHKKRKRISVDKKNSIVFLLYMAGPCTHTVRTSLTKIHVLVEVYTVVFTTFCYLTCFFRCCRKVKITNSKQI